MGLRRSPQRRQTMVQGNTIATHYFGSGLEKEIGKKKGAYPAVFRRLEKSVPIMSPLLGTTVLVAQSSSMLPPAGQMVRNNMIEVAENLISLTVAPTPSPTNSVIDQETKLSVGTVSILAVMILMVVLIFLPNILGSRCNPRSRERMRRQQAMLMGGPEFQNRTNLPHRMSMDDRKDFISRDLITKKLLTSPGSNDEESIDLSTLSRLVNDHVGSKKEWNTTAFDNSNENAQVTGNSDAIIIEPCVICFSDYEEGDHVCWSRNTVCHHVFHRECIAEWLLRHDECPCCRLNYLSTCSLENSDELDPSPTADPSELPAAIPAVSDAEQGSGHEPLSNHALVNHNDEVELTPTALSVDDPSVIDVSTQELDDNVDF
eukprot:scaffold114210_cov55-Attheya_sp.AAC.4